jgi:hypothetical protein
MPFGARRWESRPYRFESGPDASLGSSGGPSQHAPGRAQAALVIGTPIFGTIFSNDEKICCEHAG